jgi:hypothetical protein
VGVQGHGDDPVRSRDADALKACGRVSSKLANDREWGGIEPGESARRVLEPANPRLAFPAESDCRKAGVERRALAAAAECTTLVPLAWQAR